MIVNNGAIYTHRFSVLDAFEEKFPFVLLEFPSDYFIKDTYKRQLQR